MNKDTKDNQTEKVSGDIVHVSVLLQEVIDGLLVNEGETFVDMTLGGGGHSLVIGKLLGKSGTLVGIDADPTAVARAGEKLKDCPAKVHLVAENFRNVKKVFADLGIEKADKILFDLGLSTYELESSGRGFSFQKDEPLIMTFPTDASKVSFTAKDIVNTWDEENIVAILAGYGEERFAKRIAKRIVDVRKMQEIQTTKELVDVIAGAVPGWYRNGRKSHFATRTFQALRMTVNDEIRALESALQDTWGLLAHGGRIAVISFHSMEDRLVKKFFKEKAHDGKGILLTKKPTIPTDAEISENRRSRSAKLRIIKKMK